MNQYKSTLPEGTCGNWKIEKFIVDPHSIEFLRCMLHGRPVTPGEYTRLVRGHSTIMSDTPSELRDLWPFKRALEQLKAERVLIHGLGLGIALNIALSSPSVRHIDVVEKSLDVLTLVKPFIATKPGMWLHFHNSDCLEKKWPKGTRWDVVWHDIWDNVPNEDDQPEITKLKRSFGNRCKWQGVWAEGLFRRYCSAVGI